MLYTYIVILPWKKYFCIYLKFLLIEQARGWQAFSVKDQRVSIFCFVIHTVSHNYSTLPSQYQNSHRRSINKWTFLRSKNILFTKKEVVGNIWPVGHDFLTPTAGSIVMRFPYNLMSKATRGVEAFHWKKCIWLLSLTDILIMLPLC